MPLCIVIYTDNQLSPKQFLDILTEVPVLVIKLCSNRFIYICIYGHEDQGNRVFHTSCLNITELYVDLLHFI
jgi:hypothetical protein